MNYKILVGNLATNVTEAHIRELFSRALGAVVSIDIARDQRSGNCRGYAFVEMTTITEANDAIKELNGQELNGRAINLSLSDKPGKIPIKRKWYQLGKS